MAKKNYTKVEEALDEGLRKMKVKELLHITDSIKDGIEPPQVPGTALAQTTDTTALNIQLLKALQIGLGHIAKRGMDPYLELRVKKDQVIAYFDHPEKLTEDDWTKIKALKESVDRIKKDLEENAETANEEIINSQMKKQKTRRFNINDNWLPLH